MADFQKIKNEIISSIQESIGNVDPRIHEELELLEMTDGINDVNNLEHFYEIWKSGKRNGTKNAVNSLTAYQLGITSKEPDGDFLPERRIFARPGFPDVDMDFDFFRRQEIYDYIIDKYGRENVGNIGTYQALKLKSAIRRIGKALDVAGSFHKGQKEYVSDNEAKVSEIIDSLPFQSGAFIKMTDRDGELHVIKTIRDAYKHCESFRAYIDKYPDILKYSDDIEGLLTIYSCHPAGIVIGNEPLENIAPLRRAKKDSYATQYVYEELEQLGLIKFDILALSTLTVVDNTVKFIKQNYDIDIDIKNLPLDDKPTLSLYRSGNLKGVFQCESKPMQQVMRDIGVDRFDDIVAAIALFRPGPMASIPEYCARKRGEKIVDYFHPKIEPFVKPYLEETLGILIYQESLMQICNSLAGFSITDGYIMIKAVGKKKKSLMDKFAKQFVEGCVGNGIDKNIAIEYWNRFITPFALYGFNKCFSEDSIVADSMTGELINMRDVFNRFNKKEKIYVNAVNDKGKIVSRPIVAVSSNGKKLVYKVQTRSGYTLRVTKDHKIKTPIGMIPLSDINIGDYVATSRCLLAKKPSEKIEKHELITLAHLITEGNTCHPTTLYFYNNDIDLINDFNRFVSCFDDSLVQVIEQDEKRYVASVNTGRIKNKKTVPWNKGLTKDDYKTRKSTVGQNVSGVYKWALNLGLIYKKATEKVVPKIIFGLTDNEIELFVGRLWSGDGHITYKKEFSYPYYSTSSKQLAYDVRMLLLRLGILSKLTKKKFKYKDSVKIGYTVSLYDKNSLSLFINRITKHIIGRKEDILRLKYYFGQIKDHPSQRDVIPIHFKSLIREEISKKNISLASACVNSGLCSNNFAFAAPYLKKGIKYKKHSYFRDNIRKLAEAIDSKELKQLTNSDILWDRIVDISPDGECDTFDVTVETDHNLVVDGIITSNSHSLAYAILSYSCAYLKANYADEFLCTLLNVENNRRKYDKVLDYEKDVKRNGITILPLDLNKSGVDYTIAKKKDPMSGVHNTEFRSSLMTKGISKESAQEIAAHQPYKDLRDLAFKTDTKLVGKEAISALVVAGVFDHQNVREPGKRRISMEKFRIAVVEKFQRLRIDIKKAGNRGVDSMDMFEDFDE